MCTNFNYRDVIRFQHALYTGIVAVFLLTSCTNSRISEHEYSEGFTIAEELGGHCMHDAECQTPFEWARRSVCPYEARCIEQQCVVVCPKPFLSAQEECEQLEANFERIVAGDDYCEGWNFDTIHSQPSQWVGQELTDILSSGKLLFGRNGTEVELLVPEGDYMIGTFYRFDLRNVCRERLILADSRMPSPFLNDLIRPTEIDCTDRR